MRRKANPPTDSKASPVTGRRVNLVTDSKVNPAMGRKVNPVTDSKVNPAILRTRTTCLRLPRFPLNLQSSPERT
jgi:hypothetical protein